MANKKKLTRREMRRRRRQRILIIKTVALCALLVVLGVAVWFLAGSPRRHRMLLMTHRPKKS